MARNPVAEFLAQRRVMILDGALATELERRGADLHDPLWSARLLLEQPDLIRAVHRDYFEAGADIATTATYQATFEAFERHGIEHDLCGLRSLNAAALKCLKGGLIGRRSCDVGAGLEVVAMHGTDQVRLLQ